MFVHQYIIETDWEMFMKNKIWATAKTFGHDGKKDLKEQFHNSKEAVALSLIEYTQKTEVKCSFNLLQRFF